MLAAVHALLLLAALAAATPAAAATPSPDASVATDDATAALEAARAALADGDIAAALTHITAAAKAGNAEAQSQLGAAHASGYASGGTIDLDAAKYWLRLAAEQGHADAAHNLVTLCDAQPRCLGAASTDRAIDWLRAAAAQGMAEAAYEAAHLLLADAQPDDAFALFLEGARRGHTGAMYNYAHMCSSKPGRLTDAVVWFGIAARSGTDAKVAADAEEASAQVRRLWVEQAEMADSNRTTALFRSAAALAEEEEDDDDETELVRGWIEAIEHWSAFEAGFFEHASYENVAALSSLRSAMAVFASLLQRHPAASSSSSHAESSARELRRYLLLSKLAEGGKALARSDGELTTSVAWLEAIVAEPLCAEHYAVIETQPSCFNDQLASAITMWRRTRSAEGDARAEQLVALGHQHGRAATRWRTSAQTPRIYLPRLEAMGWWDAARFPVARELEAAWAAGRLAEDMQRIDQAIEEQSTQRQLGFARIVSTASPIIGPQGLDGDAAGVWSEYMLFDGTAWNERRCAHALALCSILRAAAEVSGTVIDDDGTPIPPQGQVTIFRLRPSAHVLPHVGVTNKRLVLQFPLRGWRGVRFRVADEWRSYQEGKAMVFDDSFEHEVVHDGPEDRYVLYAVLHHPGLGEAALGGAASASMKEEL